VASYYIKLKALWDEFELYRSPIVCNQTKEHQIEKEEDKLMQFLMGLNDSFKKFRSNILVMSPLPNVRQAYSLIVQEETQQQMNSDDEIFQSRHQYKVDLPIGSNQKVRPVNTITNQVIP